MKAIMTATELLTEGHKVRGKSWWWGRYIHKPVDGRLVDNNGNVFPAISDLGDWEQYNEDVHGPQHDTYANSDNNYNGSCMEASAGVGEQGLN